MTRIVREYIFPGVWFTSPIGQLTPGVMCRPGLGLGGSMLMLTASVHSSAIDVRWPTGVLACALQVFFEGHVCRLSDP